jgi:hypothetical protein
MRQSIALILLLVVGACGSTAKPGPDGGGGSSAGGAGGTGSGGRGGSGAGGCAANQVWCSGCEPGTGACYSGGCPGVACPPPDGGAAGASGSAGTTGSGGGAGAGGRGGTGGGSGGTGGLTQCGEGICTSGQLCVHPSCGGTAPQCNPLPDGGQCPTGWTYRAICNTAPTPGPGCEAPPCIPPAPYCLTRPASCGATPTCSCLPANVCMGSGACGIATSAEVLCVSA